MVYSQTYRADDDCEGKVYTDEVRFYKIHNKGRSFVMMAVMMTVMMTMMMTMMLVTVMLARDQRHQSTRVMASGMAAAMMAMFVASAEEFSGQCRRRRSACTCKQGVGLSPRSTAAAAA